MLFEIIYKNINGKYINYNVKCDYIMWEKK